MTREVAPLSRDLAARVAAQAAVLAAGAPPAVEPTPHCRRPEACAFLPRCTAGLPGDWFGHLPGLRPQHFAALREAGVDRIGAVPADFQLSPAQRNAIASLSRGTPFAAAELGSALEPLAAGADFLDFEAIMPEVPLYPGTRSRAGALPVVGSPARRGRGLRHAEFLARGGGVDPRRGFAESLVAAFDGRRLPVAVYRASRPSPGRQARVFPDLAAVLDALRARLSTCCPCYAVRCTTPASRARSR